MPKESKDNLSSNASTTSSTSSSSGMGRRHYNRSPNSSHNSNSSQSNQNNNFKFHNFVFNETNQKFCLEEQHGNKKITVMHWKKAACNPETSSLDHHNQINPSNEQQSTCDQQQQHEHSTHPVRNSESDSRLIKKCEKISYIPEICLPSKSDSIVSNDGGSRSEGVSSSASFPSTFIHPIIVHDNDIAMIHPRLSHHSDNVAKASVTVPPSLITSSSSGGSVCSSGYLHNLSSPSLESHRSSISDNQSNSTNYFSGSSLATTSKSSTCSSSGLLNFSLDNLKLNEKTNQPINQNQRNFKSSRIGEYGRGGTISGGRNNRRSRKQLIVDEDEDDEDEDFVDVESDSDHSDDDDEDFDALFYQTYRRYQKRFENILSDYENIQSQPLDLSLKSRDSNNNDKQIKEFAKEPMKKCLDDSFLMSPHSRSIGSSPNYHLDRPTPFSSGLESNWMSERNLIESMRTESLSPSDLMYSMKCSSPLSDCSMDTDKIHALTSSTTRTNPRTPSVNPFGTFPSHSEQPNQYVGSNPFSEPRRKVSTASTSSELFDSFEDRIQKFLHNSLLPTSSMSSLPSTFGRRKHPSMTAVSESNSEFNRKIEDKMKLLRQEVLALSNNKFPETNFFNFNSDSLPSAFGSAKKDDEHLKLHFKFDSNKNLEPYGDSLMEPSIFESRSSGLNSNSLAASAIGGSNISNQMSSLSSTLPRSRMNHRNQIKRHLEDAFKQNGFLVKTKQVSDANNSAMFCKFRQLRKYTRYYLKSWQNHLPDEVNKLWKGFLPPKSERPLFMPSSSVTSMEDHPRTTMDSTFDFKTTNTTTAASSSFSSASSTAFGVVTPTITISSNETGTKPLENESSNLSCHFKSSLME